MVGHVGMGEVGKNIEYVGMVQEDGGICWNVLEYVVYRRKLGREWMCRDGTGVCWGMVGHVGIVQEEVGKILKYVGVCRG